MPAASALYARSLRTLTLLAAPALAGLAAISALAVPLLFGPRWVQAKALLPPLCLALLAQAYFPINAAFLNGVGRVRAQTWSTIATNAAILAAILISLRSGVVAVSWSVAIASAAAGILQFMMVARVGSLRLSAFAHGLKGGLISAGVMYVASSSLEARLEGDLAPVLRLAATVAIGIMTYGASVLALEGSSVLSPVKQRLRALGVAA